MIIWFAIMLRQGARTLGFTQADSLYSTDYAPCARDS
jgi:hypothetical protein